MPSKCPQVICLHYKAKLVEMDSYMNGMNGTSDPENKQGTSSAKEGNAIYSIHCLAYK